MVCIVFLTQQNERLALEVPPEGSVMQAAKSHGIPGIEAACGSCMSCGTCHVIVDPAWYPKLPEPSAIERAILEGVPGPQANTRLTCQIPVTEALDGIVLRIPRAQF